VRQDGLLRRPGAGWLVILSLLLLPLSVAVAQSAPATAPVTQPVDAGAAEAAKLRSAGIENALAGRFETAVRQLHRSQEIHAHSAAAAAAKLLEDHLERARQADGERSKEYADAVRRVRRSMLAQAYLPRLIEAGLVSAAGDDGRTGPTTNPHRRPATGKANDEKDLRRKVMAVVLAYNEAGDSDALEEASAKEAEKLKAGTSKSLSKACDALREVGKLLSDDSSRYAKSFREVADVLGGQLRKYAQVWSSVNVKTFASRHEAADRLRKVEEQVSWALGDLEAMVSPKPWQVGLSQARLAKELAVDKDKVVGEDWYQTIKKIVEERGENAVADSRWYDALGAYVGLSELEPDNDFYKDRAKTVRKHVRVLSLYGDGRPGASAANTRPREDRTGFREIVAGVDKRMVETAITRMDELYVSSPDYRRIARGALGSVRVLAETPQAVHSFPRLKDEGLRKKFLDAVAKEVETVEKDNRVDHMDILYALGGVLRASERTVSIPIDVLAVEFAEGMVEELDKFSSMIWPHDVQDFHKQTMGRFVGVGIQITKERGQPLKVVTPLPNSPGYKQGIKSGDMILAVDGRRTEDLSIDKLVRMITGEKGTLVVLRIKRPGWLKPKDFPIMREEIRIRTVKGWRRLKNGDWDFMIDKDRKIGYIRITQFTDQTPSDIHKTLRDLRASGMRSLVLDMRFNPGGLLRSAVQVADEFLQTGRLVSTKGRATRATVLKASPGGEFLQGDLVVLVNRYSASAAEIVSGALKDWRRGLIVGERTFGKGSVQNVIQIRRDRAYLKLTTAYYYLPSGRLLHRKNGSKTWGVDPDVKVQLTPEQTKRWLGIRRKTDLLQDIDAEELKSKLAGQLDADLQLQTALLLLNLLRLQETV